MDVQQVIFLQIWTAEPVFHRFGSFTRIEGKGWVDFTACGREVGTYKPWLPYKHAVKFGRPCRGCWGRGT